uniref:Ubiquitin-like protease family profile domain-containing protein n=1 Tax=Oryza punctata TaxID=4537 RepID=A0A0E0M100_ORYPU
METLSNSDSPDVVIIGENKFSTKCVDTGKKTNMLYNNQVAVDIDGVHCKFSSFGGSSKPESEDDLLKHPSKSDFNSVRKCFHGPYYARPVQSCEMMFVFLDSLNGEGSAYKEQVKTRLTSNFALACNSIMTDYTMNFDEFKTIYPPVPRQNNIVDCGIFSMKFLEVWAPRVQLTNQFSQKDIPNIRIQYVNRLFFHPDNSMLNTNIKKLVTDSYVQG